MLKRIWSALRGYTPIITNSVNLHAQGPELVVFTDTIIAQGERVRVELPEGKRVFGHAAWSREVQNSNESVTQSAVGVVVSEPQELEGVTFESRKARQHRRFEHRQWVSFPDRRGMGSITLDLSVEGFRMVGDLTDLVGETHRIRLELPGSSECISARAKILWSHSGETGLRFLNMHVGDEAALAKSLGLATYPAQDAWSSLWKRSLESLSFRVTPVDETSVSIDFETLNWLSTFEIEEWQAEGAWTGTFARVETKKDHPNLLKLRQKLGLNLQHRHDLIDLSLLDSENQTVLTIWGVERSFKRTKRA